MQELYHGTSIHSMIGTAEGGFKAGLGAGCDALQEHFGIPVAGTYVAKTWTVASYYPMETSSNPHPANKDGVPGGSLRAQDNSFPMRVVIRCLADTKDQLWHKGSYQSLYKPMDLHITHISIYAVGPHLVHTYLLYNLAGRNRIKNKYLDG